MRFDVLLDRHISSYFTVIALFFVTTLPRGFLLPSVFFFFFWKKNEQKIPFFRNKKAIKNHFFVATKKGAAGLFGLVLSFSLSLSPVLEKASSS